MSRVSLLGAVRRVSCMFLVAGVCCVSAFAQASRAVAASERRIEDFNKQRDKADREAMNRELRGKKPSKEELEQAARIKAETKEDLEGLQSHYNLIIEKLSGGGTPSPEFAADAFSKINKHAARLRTNVAFPKPEPDAAEPAVNVPAETRKRLRELCARIYEFLTNPIIENPSVLDIKSAGAARISLEAVIALSSS